MIRMRFIMFATAVLLLFAAPGLAQDHVVTSTFVFNPAPTPPAPISWRLATESGEFVELVPPAAMYSGGAIVHFVTPDNAAEYGLDFAAWSAAVNDPAFNRSIMSFGGVVQEKTWTNPWRGEFELERIQLFVNDFDPRFTHPSVQGFIVDVVPVPEPSTDGLIVLACLTFNAVAGRLSVLRRVHRGTGP
jgi:hypothetical protein